VLIHVYVFLMETHIFLFLATIALLDMLSLPICGVVSLTTETAHLYERPEWLDLSKVRAFDPGVHSLYFSDHQEDVGSTGFLHGHKSGRLVKHS